MKAGIDHEAQGLLNTMGKGKYNIHRFLNFNKNIWRGTEKRDIKKEKENPTTFKRRAKEVMEQRYGRVLLIY